MVDIAEVVLGQPHHHSLVGANEQRAGRGIDLDHRPARAVADAEPIVVAPADETIPRRPLPARGDDPRGPEETRVVQRTARHLVEHRDLVTIVGEDEAARRIEERRLCPRRHEGRAGVARVLETGEASVLGEEGERLAGTPLGEALGDLTLQVRALATVLGELGRAQSIAERGEAAGRVDRRQLGAVADQDQPGAAPGCLAREPLERARRHHRGLVADDHRAGGNRLLVPARDAIEQERRRLRRDAGVALQDVGGLALPGDADHRDVRALVGLAHRLEGEGLAGPRPRLHDAHPGIARAEVTHRGGLV